MPRISLIAAMTDRRIIGHDGGMPWHLPDDLRHFKALTMGKPVLMGRKTFESIGRPLPGRRNIVISRKGVPDMAGIEVAGSLEEALARADDGTTEEIMVIGGGEIYRLALPRAERIYLTHIEIDAPGDTVFPEIDPRIWHEVARVSHPARDGRPAYSFVTLERRSSPTPS